MKIPVVLAVLYSIVLYSCSKNSTGSNPVTPPDTTHTGNTDTGTGAVHLQYRGADLSFLPEIEQAGTVFYDSTGAKPALDIFKEYGCNVVRVRLWYQPTGVHSALPEVLSFCRQIHDAGMQVLLDFHYSDTWADPSHQSTPAAWAGLSPGVLKDSVKAYTQRVTAMLIAQNTPPAIIQVGNEINAGMLWDAGKVTGFTDANWTQFAALLKSGIEGIKAADAANSILIMLHYAEVDGAADFFTKMSSLGVTYNIAGLSYYPWWAEKDLNYVQQQFNAVAALDKKVFIAETAYPWTLGWKDYTNNVVGENGQLITAYPATPQGQYNFLMQLKTMLAAIPNSRGIGFCYWAPDWVAFKGNTATDGSNWENLTLFDFNNKALQGLEAYGE